MGKWLCSLIIESVIAGEITCGYADGGFTQEQTLLVAYHRGRMCRDHGITGGLMAAVGLGAADADKRLAQAGAVNCVVACDNSPSSTTLSGEGHILFEGLSCIIAYTLEHLLEDPML